MAQSRETLRSASLNQPVHVLQMRSSVEEIVNLATIAVLDAQKKESAKK